MLEASIFNLNTRLTRLYDCAVPFPQAKRLDILQRDTAFQCKYYSINYGNKMEKGRASCRTQPAMVSLHRDKDKIAYNVNL